MAGAKLVLAAALVVSLAVVGGLYYVATRPSGPGGGGAQEPQQGAPVRCGFWARPGLALAYEYTETESPGGTDRDYAVIVVAGADVAKGEADVLFINDYGMERAIESLASSGAIQQGEAPSDGRGMAMFILNRVLADPGLAGQAASYFDDYTLKYRFNYSDPDQVEDYIDEDPGLVLVPAPCNQTKTYVRAIAEVISGYLGDEAAPRISVEEGGNETVLAYNVTITPTGPSDYGRVSIHIEILRELLIIKKMEVSAANAESNETETITIRLLGEKTVPESVIQALAEGLGGGTASLKIFPDSAVYAANNTLRLHIANPGDAAIVITGIELNGQSLDLAEAWLSGDAYMGSHTGVPSIVVEPGGMATVYVPVPIDVATGAAYTVTIYDANGNVYTAVVYGI